MRAREQDRKLVFLGAALLLQGVPASAQSVSGIAGSHERIEVTGTRIAVTDLESASPVAILKAEDIKMDGFNSLELILNSLPQVVESEGNRIANGASGTATVNHRGLGDRRTLVLVNGRRLPLGSPWSQATDLNQIPAPLVSRVDILTGGASAVCVCVCAPV